MVMCNHNGEYVVSTWNLQNNLQYQEVTGIYSTFNFFFACYCILCKLSTGFESAKSFQDTTLTLYG